MTKTEIKKIIKEILLSRLKEKAFVFNDSTNSLEKDYGNLVIRIQYQLLNEFDEQTLINYSYFVIKEVEKIIGQLNEKFPACNFHSEKTNIHTFSGYNNSTYEIKDEEGLISTGQKIKFSTNDPFALKEGLERHYNYLCIFIIPFVEENLIDIKKIDSVINGEDFWETDWENGQPKGYYFGQGLNFFCRRLIIAHLCDNPRKDELFDFHLDFYRKNLEEYPIVQNWIDVLTSLKEILKDIEPLYQPYLKTN